jgi:small-conductance mechanosensitive channel
MVLIGAFLALSEVGYNIVPVITGLGIGGVAIGLGAQSLVKDTINGLFILGENQFGYGDWVTLAGVSGVVEDVNLRRTLIRDLDGTVYTIPNSAIIVSGNHTRGYSGINVTVLIPQAANLDRALALATEMGKQLAADPELGRSVLEAPHPARIETIDQNGATLRILGKAVSGTQAQLSFEYRRRLMDALSAAGLLGATASAAPPGAPAAPGNGRAQNAEGAEADRGRR